MDMRMDTKGYCKRQSPMIWVRIIGSMIIGHILRSDHRRYLTLQEYIV